MDRLQASLDEVLADNRGRASSQVEALLRHLTDPASGQGLDERLAGLLAGQEAGQEQWQALAEQPERPGARRWRSSAAPSSSPTPWPR